MRELLRLACARGCSRAGPCAAARGSRPSRAPLLLWPCPPLNRQETKLKAKKSAAWKERLAQQSEQQAAKQQK